ncbi:hypothetical protein AFK68_23710 [Hydrocoleum sp. CS-953]|nr:hypothetical protein AFK68_23710 [Hydrocoleum sp. CS-953]
MLYHNALGAYLMRSHFVLLWIALPLKTVHADEINTKHTKKSSSGMTQLKLCIRKWEMGRWGDGVITKKANAPF